MKDFGTYDELDIIQKITLGDKDAFHVLYERYESSVSKSVFQIVKSKELSKDIVQNIFIKLWESRTHIDKIKSLDDYLWIAAKNQSLNYLKRASIDKNALAIILQSYPENHSKTEDMIDSVDYLRYLEQQLQNLPEQSREVFKLCRQEFKSYDEAAEILGISRNTVKKHMTRSMKRLGDAVERDLGLKLSTFLTILFLN